MIRSSIKHTPDTAPELHEYTSDIDGWVAGRRVARGDIVELTAAAARYEPVTPRASGVAAPFKTPDSTGPVKDGAKSAAKGEAGKKA